MIIVVGEEQPGGLVIVRASSARPQLLQEPPPSSRQPSNPPPTRNTANGTIPVPPAKKYKAGFDVVEAQEGKRKERVVLAENRTEPEIDEDVRIMQSEADILRQQSRSAAESSHSNGANPDFQFPAPTPNGRNKSLRPPPSQSRGRTVTRETSQPINDQETPRIERNKMLRADPGHSARRKSSLTRGKRITTSYANTGVIGA